MTFRAITDSDIEKVDIPKDLGGAPQLQWIPIKNLVVDDCYQRELADSNRANIRRIARNFRWSRFSPVVASPIEGGDYAIIDGQHRSTAAFLIGIEKVPCSIIIADTEEQARAFAAINKDLTRVPSHQIFAAKLAAKDETALRALKVCTESGVKLLRHPERPHFNKTLAVATIQRSIRVYGEKATRISLSCLVSAAPRKDMTFLRPLPIQATVEALVAKPDWLLQEAQLVEHFRKIGLEELVEGAKRDAPLKGESTARILLFDRITVAIEELFLEKSKEMAA